MATRKVSERDIKMLYGLSAARCNICAKVLFEPKVNEDGFIHVGEMAHNIAFSEMASAPRAIDGMSEDNSYQNLILLCANDHLNVDQNTRFYTVDKIREIKTNFEKNIHIRLDEKVKPDQHLVNLINGYYNLQSILNQLNDPLYCLPFNIDMVLRIYNEILIPSIPSSFPFNDENLNQLMAQMIDFSSQLPPFLNSYYFPHPSGDLRPTREKPILFNDEQKIRQIVASLYQAIFNWLHYCRTDYS